MNKLKGLICCEESGVVTLAFRNQGIETYSCDILPTSGQHPEWHYQEDAINHLKNHYYDFVIAFPPCTALAVSGARWFEEKRKNGEQQKGIDFFMFFANLDVRFKAIENPVGIMSSIYRKPDQIIQPYYFGDEARKTTCLWLYNLPKLNPTDIVGQGEDCFYIGKNGRKLKLQKWITRVQNLSTDERHRLRSRTFPGIANAMSHQWGKYMLRQNG